MNYIDSYVSKHIKEQWHYMVRKRYRDPQLIINDYQRFTNSLKQFEQLDISEEVNDVIEAIISFDYEVINEEKDFESLMNDL